MLPFLSVICIREEWVIQSRHSKLRALIIVILFGLISCSFTRTPEMLPIVQLWSCFEVTRLHLSGSSIRRRGDQEIPSGLPYLFTWRRCSCCRVLAITSFVSGDDAHLLTWKFMVDCRRVYEISMDMDISLVFSSECKFRSLIIVWSARALGPLLSFNSRLRCANTIIIICGRLRTAELTVHFILFYFFQRFRCTLEWMPWH